MNRSGDDLLGLGIVAPHNPDAESAVLGGILADNDGLGKVLGIIQAEDFYRESHRKIFAAYLDLNEQTKPIDLITLSDHLKSQDDLEAVGGATYLASLEHPTAANIAFHAKIIRRSADQRRQIELGRELIQRAARAYEDPAVVASSIASKLLSFQSTQTSGFIRVDELVTRALKRIETAYESKTLLKGIPSGLNVFERECGAIRRGQLVVIGGRTSTGKTSLALCMARAAAGGGFPAAFVSAESPLDEITIRLLSQVSGVENTRLQYAALKDADLGRLANSAEHLFDLPIWLLGGVQKWELIKAVTRGLKAKIPELAIVFVDYAQLLDAKTEQRRRDLEVSKISAESKALAIELDMAVCLLSQLNRELEKQNEREPILSDLKESGSLEQDADVVLLLYRNKASDDDTRVFIKAAKVRDGRTDIIPMRFDKRTVSFTDWGFV